MILTELVMEASLPNGVLSIIHGTYNIVDAISDDDDIEVVSFVGSMLLNCICVADHLQTKVNVLRPIWEPRIMQLSCLMQMLKLL